MLLACVSPAKTNHDESISTLEFAVRVLRTFKFASRNAMKARCKLIKTNAKKNEQER